MRRQLAAALLALGLAGTVPVLGLAEEGGRADGLKQVRIVTASPGGTYFQYGTRLAELIERRTGLRAIPLVSGGPYQNMPLVNLGEAEIGFVTLGPARECWTGKCPTAPGVEMRNVRAAFPMYETPFHVLVPADGGVRRLEDLEGGTIGIGPYEGTPGTYFPRFLRDLGIGAAVRYGTFDALADEFLSGGITAIGLAGGVPVPAGLRVAQERPIALLSIAPERLAAIAAKYPSLDRFTIPAGSYPGQTTALPTVSMWNFVVVHKNLPEKFVHDLVEALLRDGAAAVLHPAAANIRAEDIGQNGYLWLHPGALRSFRARGIAIPANLIPPEAKATAPGGKP